MTEREKMLDFVDERRVYLAHLYRIGIDDPVWLDEQLAVCQDTYDRERDND